jgi:predicted Na+-dependent transporter
VAGVTVLPLMIFHLLQLVVSSILAQRWQRQGKAL